MNIDFNSERPIFIQIADSIKDAIIFGAYPEESQIPSTTEISVKFKINPATALKGMNMLVDEGIIYKKRGLGMFVAEGAVKKLIENRKELFYESYVAKMIAEAKRLDISRQDIIALIERGFDNE